MENNEPFIDSEFVSKLDAYFTNSTHNLGGNLLKYIHKKVQESGMLFSSKSIQIELVLDTNILYQEVRSLMLNGTSFLLKIIDNPLIKFFAPPQIKEEIMEKIDMKFPKDKKTQNIDLVECKVKALLLLDKIEIMSAKDFKSVNAAHALMEKRDVDDACFVALSLSIKTHGIVSNDKDLEAQKEVKIWKLKEAGKCLSVISKGTYSFYILQKSMPIVFEVIKDIVMSFMNLITEMIKSFLKFVKLLANGSLDALLALPPEIQGVLGITLLIVMLIDKSREAIIEFVKQMWQSIVKVCRRIYEFVMCVYDIIKTFIEILKPFFLISFDIIHYLFDNYNQSIKELDEIEKLKPV